MSIHTQISRSSQSDDTDRALAQFDRHIAALEMVASGPSCSSVQAARYLIRARNARAGLTRAPHAGNGRFELGAWGPNGYGPMIDGMVSSHTLALRGSAAA